MRHSEEQIRKEAFIASWQDRGNEEQDYVAFWTELLSEVFCVKKPTKYFETQKHVIINGNHKKIDIYFPDTRVLVEQKSFGHKTLDTPTKHGETNWTPYEQAKAYADALPTRERPNYIITCNFSEFRIYDMNEAEPQKKMQVVKLANLAKEYYRLNFIVDLQSVHLEQEMECSIAAGEIIAELYDALLEEYQNPSDPKILRELNILCVRLVFCLYAEDAGLFKKNAFGDYLVDFAGNPSDFRQNLILLFRTLNIPEEKRDPYAGEINNFPYVNGGLFEEEVLPPRITEKIIRLILEKACNFDWSDISPTIFGSLFESTLNPITRRIGGMHYTSIENIHKVIDPLFLDDLKKELLDIKKKKVAKDRRAALLRYQEKLGSLTFLDPACGSGNFLTETYISLRRLENEVLASLNSSGYLDLGDTIKVKIGQFYGIEINDFAVEVARTALWIAENQMLKRTEKLIPQLELDFLPLKSNANIVCDNALLVDWISLYDLTPLPPPQCWEGEHTEINGENLPPPRHIGEEGEDVSVKLTKGKGEVYSYIIGNPPFSGARIMQSTSEQKADISLVFAGVKGAGNLDYVCAWYKKAAELVRGSNTKVAFVSTNSICQGQHVSILWKLMFELGTTIDFAYKTFKWVNETADKANMAAVHCIIVGFSDKNSPKKDKVIFAENGEPQTVSNINAYLCEAANIIIVSRSAALCDVPPMVFGSMPNDGGNFILSESETDEFIKKEPKSKEFIRLFIGAEEFINNKKRYCLWLKNAEPSDLRKIKMIAERVENVRKIRSESNRKATRRLADTPWLFGEIRQPESGTYLLVPRVSSERRKYIPVGFLTHDVIASDATQIIPNAGLYEFGILTSNVHNAWMRIVCGRLKSDYRYSANIVYNNFPWCNPTSAQKSKIEKTASSILKARENHPTSSLADLYDENTMPVDLRKAHEDNNRAVMAAYGFNPKMSEDEIVAELFRMYEKLTLNL